ncbi:unnamed protein product [Diabrotica balteata]|uniref:Cuticle protein n=1 Tax=Diabrotica balteata TaxID=107213 RepID=A0A9N9T7E0_DIABA|nr:unnamed protein product [Diabrotica balteata]
MAVKYIIFAAFIASASAYEHHHAPAAQSYVTYTTLSQSHAAPAVYSAPVAHTKAAPVVQSYAAPATLAYTSVPETVVADHSAPAHYDFAYDVNDPHTGDSKSQHESRHGDFVHGSYSLLESDGTKRVVDYTADSRHGFKAVVHKEHAASPAVPNNVAPVAYAFPVDSSAYTAPKSHAASVSVNHGDSIVQVYSSPLVSSYTSNLHNGLNAVVPNEHSIARSAPNVVSPVAYAAPVAHASYSSQVSDATPVASGHGATIFQAYSAPLVPSYTINPHNGFYSVVPKEHSQDPAISNAVAPVINADSIVQGAYAAQVSNGASGYGTSVIQGYSVPFVSSYTGDHQNKFLAGVNKEHDVGPVVSNGAAPAVYAVPVANAAYATLSFHAAAVAPGFGTSLV